MEMPRRSGDAKTKSTYVGEQHDSGRILYFLENQRNLVFFVQYEKPAEGRRRYGKAVVNCDTGNHLHKQKLRCLMIIDQTL